MAQSVIEFLEMEFVKLEQTVGVYGVMYELLEKAKAMHKEEIKKSWMSAWKDSMANPLEDKYYEPEAENYYNETFGK